MWLLYDPLLGTCVASTLGAQLFFRAYFEVVHFWRRSCPFSRRDDEDVTRHLILCYRKGRKGTLPPTHGLSQKWRGTLTYLGEIPRRSAGKRVEPSWGPGARRDLGQKD